MLQRLRRCLATGAICAVLATSGLAFAHGPVGPTGPAAPGRDAPPPPTGTSQPHRWNPTRPAADNGWQGGFHGVHGRNRLTGSDWRSVGPRPGFGVRPLPPLRPRGPWIGPGPYSTCFALTSVSGTVDAVIGLTVSVTTPQDTVATLVLSPSVVVTEGGVGVPLSALAPGEIVSATVNCRGRATAIAIAG